jgi:Bacterial capsule synthesis protein PGA_cap
VLLWKDLSNSIVTRFGIAGDFLPASGLHPTNSRTWAEMAASVSESFAELDFTIVNLECPVNVGPHPARLKPSLGDSFSAPHEALDYLRALKCKVVSLANNHSYDHDSPGVAATKSALDAAGITGPGADVALDDPPDTHVINNTANAGRVGIWCAALAIRECATKTRRGLEPATLERGKAALASMKSRGATCCVAFLHAGAEGTNRPDPSAVKLMNSLAQTGFHVVAACHSHRISGFAEVVQSSSLSPAFCFYGLGSLSSGVIYGDLEREGLLASIGLNSEGRVVSVEAKPLYLAGRGWAAIPTNKQKESIVSRFLSISREIRDGSYEDAFYKDIGQDFLRKHWRDLCLAFNRAGFRGIIAKLSRIRIRHFRTLLHSHPLADRTG